VIGDGPESTSAPSLTLVGRSGSPVTRKAEQIVRRHRRHWTLRIATPAEFPLPDEDPRAQADLMLFAVDHPDDEVIDIDRAWEQAPLTRWLICRGDWCESAGRTRGRWPQAVDIPISALTSQLQLEFDVLQNRSVPTAMTSDRNEVFAAGHPPCTGSPLQEISIAWAGPDRTLGEAILTSCRAAGATLSDDAGTTADVLLFDGDPWTATRQEQLAQQVAGGPPVVVLFGYLRPQYHDRAVSHGAATAIEKLVPEQELFDAILAAVGRD